MSGLAELQEFFARAVRGGDAEAALSSLMPGGEEGLAIYRDNLEERGRAALADVYPVVERLVGGAFFAHAARLHMREQPSQNGDIHDFGAGFAGFLARFPLLAGLPYLPDVARLEWAVHRVYHAADSAPLDLAALSGLAAAERAGVTLALAPACRLVSSRHPIHRIWSLHQPGVAWDPAFTLDEGGVRLLVRREAGHRIVCLPLSEVEHCLLAALAAGMVLGAAFDHSSHAGSVMELVAALRRHLLEGTLVRREAGAEHP